MSARSRPTENENLTARREHALADLYALMVYRTAQGEPQAPAPTRITFADLYRQGLLTDDHVDKLESVVACVRAGGRLFEQRELVLAWLEAFEVLASARGEGSQAVDQAESLTGTKGQ